MTLDEKIIVVDFAGTLIKAEIIEEANEFRSEILQRELPSKDEHGDADKLYKNNRDLVENLTGVNGDMSVRYRENDGDYLDLIGSDLQNQIATNLFQIGMYKVAKKYGLGIFNDGFVDTLLELRGKGKVVAIASGVRADIISGMMQIAGFDGIDIIAGQSPILGRNNYDLFEEVNKQGDIVAVVGDKLSDLEPAKKYGAYSIFYRGGHPTGGEEDFADYSIDSPKELLNILK